jgi:chaperonin cofactor prefoldin
MAQCTVTVGGLEHGHQQVDSTEKSMRITVSMLLDQVPGLQQQLSELSASLQQHQQQQGAEGPCHHGKATC